MKRIHLVGVSKDGRRLHLAQKQGAKFPSMELALTPKVRKTLREMEAARLAARGKKPPEEELEEARRAASAAEIRAKQAGARAQKAWERQQEAERRIRELEGQGEGAEGPPAADGPDATPPPDGPPEGEAEAASGEEAGEGRYPEQTPPAPEPRERRDLAPDSKLTPAEIQTLLRSGRGIRSVAKQAEAPVDWVRRLAAPIESERLGAVTQLLRSYVVRSRLGRSALPIGPAIVENLRDKGVRFPERIVEEGWAAWRPDGRDWRVRFVYESRGRRQRADWHFDPQTREVRPQNTLAQELGFRSPARSGNLDRQTAEVNAAAIRPRRITGGQASSGSRGGPKGSAKRTPRPAKRSTRSKGSAKRSSKRSAGRASRSKAGSRRRGGSRR